MKEFEDVRNWSAIRGIGSGENPDPQVQTQRMLQEAIEIHDAVTNNDRAEIMDSCGDTIVTIINLCKLYDFTAEECLASAFGVIKLRKGVTTERGDFVRYGKLNDEDKLICDTQQGNAGNEYFLEEALETLNPVNFRKA